MRLRTSSTSADAAQIARTAYRTCGPAARAAGRAPAHAPSTRNGVSSTASGSDVGVEMAAEPDAGQAHGGADGEQHRERGADLLRCAVLVEQCHRRSTDRRGRAGQAREHAGQAEGAASYGDLHRRQREQHGEQHHHAPPRRRRRGRRTARGTAPRAPRPGTRAGSTHASPRQSISACDRARVKNGSTTARTSGSSGIRDGATIVMIGAETRLSPSPTRACIVAPSSDHEDERARRTPPLKPRITREPRISRRGRRTAPAGRGCPR